MGNVEWAVAAEVLLSVLLPKVQARVAVHQNATLLQLLQALCHADRLLMVLVVASPFATMPSLHNDDSVRSSPNCYFALQP